jgi:hypothetical protein
VLGTSLDRLNSGTPRRAHVAARLPPSPCPSYPDAGYEVDTSPFRPGAGEQVVEASLALLAALRA